MSAILCVIAFADSLRVFGWVRVSPLFYSPLVLSPVFSLVATTVGIVVYRRCKHDAALLAIIFGVITFVISALLWATGTLD